MMGENIPAPTPEPIFFRRQEKLVAKRNRLGAGGLGWQRRQASDSKTCAIVSAGSRRFIVKSISAVTPHPGHVTCSQ